MRVDERQCKESCFDLLFFSFHTLLALEKIMQQLNIYLAFYFNAHMNHH